MSFCIQRSAAVCSVALVIWSLAVSPVTAQAPGTIVEALSETAAFREREDAVYAIQESVALRENEQVRVALIAALERALDEYLVSLVRDDVSYTEGQGEVLLATMDTVALLRDLRAIPVFLRSLGVSLGAEEGLAALGGAAVAPLLALEDAQPRRDERNQDAMFQRMGLLETLALIADANADHLGAYEARVRAVASEALARPDHYIVLGRAIELAIALDDPGLRAEVEAIARDSGEMQRRGIDVPYEVAWVQERAQEWLDRPRR